MKQQSFIQVGDKIRMLKGTCSGEILEVEKYIGSGLIFATTCGKHFSVRDQGDWWEKVDTSKVLFTAKQEYSMHLLLAQRSLKWIRDFLEKNPRMYDLPKDKILRAIEWGYAIKPGSVKIKSFKDIQTGMLLMEKGSKEQYRIDTWNGIFCSVGVRTVGYPPSEARHFKYEDYGKTWWIVGDIHDESGGELYHLKRPEPKKPHPIIALHQKEKQQQSTAEALQAELDYELASLHHALSNDDVAEVERSKQRLAEIHEELYPQILEGF